MTKTAVQAGAFLHNLAFESSHPDRLARFYGNIMNMTVSKISPKEWRCEGPGRRLTIVEGTDKKLCYAGFACRDEVGLNCLRSRAEYEKLEIKANLSPFFFEESFSLIDPNGNRICFGLAKPDTICHKGIPGPLQHLTFAATDVMPFIEFYEGKLGFSLTDRVIKEDGSVATAFMTSNHEHHTLACFKSNYNGIDHHSYEAGDWIYIRDWCDHFSTYDVRLVWGPGRHGPGNNLFVFIIDPDGNWVEISAELEVIFNRKAVDWIHHPRTLNKWGPDAVMRS